MLESLEIIGYVKPNDQKSNQAVEMRTQILPQDEVIFWKIKYFLFKVNFFQLKPLKKGHGHSHANRDLSLVQPVAWMIIFGDGLHNFIGS